MAKSEKKPDTRSREPIIVRSRLKARLKRERGEAVTVEPPILVASRAEARAADDSPARTAKPATRTATKTATKTATTPTAKSTSKSTTKATKTSSRRR